MNREQKRAIKDKIDEYNTRKDVINERIKEINEEKVKLAEEKEFLNTRILSIKEGIE